MKGYFLMPHPPVMIPEVGMGREKEVMKTIESCKVVGKRIKESGAETIIIISPHGTVFRDGIAIITSKSLKGDLGSFRAPQVEFDYIIDTELTSKIIKNAEDKGIGVAPLNGINASRYGISLELDHGAMVPLYFIGKEYKLVHITYGMLSPIELMNFGVCVKNAVRETKSNAVFIASGDLSHRLTEDGPYPYTPLGAKFDKELIELLEKGELKKLFELDNDLVREAGECGLRSLYILAGALNSTKVQGELLSYEGPLGVGYGVMEFKENGGELLKEMLKEKEVEHKRRIVEGNPYTKLARKNLDKYFNEGKYVELSEIEDKELLNDKKGVFVSMKINGELRGCIGTIAPTTNSVAEEIIKNSISAALNDPRFLPVKNEELLEVDISVDLLFPPEPTTFEELDPKVYGVIVSYGQRRGLLLPNLEGVNSKEYQVEIALEKGGISADKPYTLERFKVERFKEVEGDE